MPLAPVRGHGARYARRSHGRRLVVNRLPGDFKIEGALLALRAVLRAMHAADAAVGDAVGEPGLVPPDDVEEAIAGVAEGALTLPRFDHDVLGDREVAAAALAEVARRGALQLAGG